MMATPPQHSSGPDAAPIWDDAALAAPHAQPDKAARVERMFDAVAPDYERVNRVASLGRDAVWRRRTIAAAVVRPSDVVLDVCCGTGDMIRAFAAHERAPKRIIGVDFSAEMLRCGRYVDTGTPISLLRADAQRLPIASASIDIVTCAFGVRNFGSLAAGIAEMARVLKPGGRLLILEFANPASPLLRWLHRTYCERVIPITAGLLSRERVGAYRYLARSIRTFETTASMLERLAACGLVEVSARTMNFGGVVLYRGVRANPA